MATTILDNAFAERFESEVDLSKPVVGGQSTRLTWHFRNNGTTTWQPNYRFVYTPMPPLPITLGWQKIQLAPKSVYTLAELGINRPIPPNEAISLSLTVWLPKSAEQYASQWQLQTNDQQPFGPVRWVRFTIIENSPLPTPDLTPVLRGKQIGITLSHYEFDIDQLNDAGEILSKKVEGEVSGNYSDVLTKFDVLRFMNWQKTNVNPIWKEGSRPEFHLPPYSLAEWNSWQNDQWLQQIRDLEFDPLNAPWSGALGVPLSICLHVAKQTNAHPWICLPHGRTWADFEAMMHAIVDTTLNALRGTQLVPIFEFSNEIWNGGRFRQQVECANLEERGIASQEKTTGDPLKLALAWQRKCTNALANYVQGRGFVVLSAQANNPWIAETLLSEPLSPHISALAIAPYIGVVRDKSFGIPDLPDGFHPLIDLITKQKITTEKALYENLLRYLELEPKRVIGRHATLAKDHHLRFWTYEAGLDLVYNDKYVGMKENEVNALYTRFHRSWFAGDIIGRLKKMFYDAGGELFTAYSSATIYQKPDFFGHFDLMGKEKNQYHATHKLKQLLENQ